MQHEKKDIFGIRRSQGELSGQQVHLGAHPDGRGRTKNQEIRKDQGCWPGILFQVFPCQELIIGFDLRGQDHPQTQAAGARKRESTYQLILANLRNKDPSISVASQCCASGPLV